MRVTDFVEDVWVLARHISNDDVRLIDLIKNAIEHPFDEDLLIYTLRICPCVLCGPFDAKFVYVVELFIEWHQHKGKGLGRCALVKDLIQDAASACDHRQS